MLCLPVPVCKSHVNDSGCLFYQVGFSTLGVVFCRRSGPRWLRILSCDVVVSIFWRVTVMRLLGRLSVFAAALMMTAQPLMAGWDSAETNRQRLVGVSYNGNPSYKCGTRRGTGKLLIYRDGDSCGSRPSLVLLLGKGQVQNKTRRPTVFRDLPTPISLPKMGRRRQKPLQGTGNVLILGWPWSSSHHNTTTAYWDGQRQQQP